MKATTVILAAALTLQISVFAGNADVKMNSAANNTPVPVEYLTPTTPGEATFEEMTEITTVVFSDLAPVMPVEADFSDVVPEQVNDFLFLTPVTPAVADFEELR